MSDFLSSLRLIGLLDYSEDRQAGLLNTPLYAPVAEKGCLES